MPDNNLMTMSNIEDSTPRELKAMVIPTVDTLENWESVDPVIPLGMLIAVKNAVGFETHFKIGLGNRKFSETPWVHLSATVTTSEVTEPVTMSAATGTQSNTQTVVQNPPVKDSDTPEGE